VVANVRYGYAKYVASKLVADIKEALARKHVIPWLEWIGRFASLTKLFHSAR
jgi:hypothetical protein